MKTIVISKLKIFKYGNERHCESQVIGYINWYKDGKLTAFSDSDSARETIKTILKENLDIGISKYSSQQKGSRTFEYENILKITDPKFPICLAEQISESGKKINEFFVKAELQKDFEKSKESWKKVNENTYRICFK